MQDDLTEFEIDQLLEEMNIKEDEPLEFDPDDIRDANETSLCEHDFMEYEGAREAYNFCRLCGEKR